MRSIQPRALSTFPARSDGYVVDTAEDGISALAAIEVERPEVALIDLGLPEFNGYEVARRVRKKWNSNEIRLIALTGYGQPSDRERTLAAGFDDHLTKPVDLDLLKAVLARGVGESIESEG